MTEEIDVRGLRLALTTAFSALSPAVGTPVVLLLDNNVGVELTAPATEAAEEDACAFRNMFVASRHLNLATSATDLVTAWPGPALPIGLTSDLAVVFTSAIGESAESNMKASGPSLSIMLRRLLPQLTQYNPSATETASCRQRSPSDHKTRRVNCNPRAIVSPAAKLSGASNA